MKDTSFCTNYIGQIFLWVMNLLVKVMTPASASDSITPFLPILTSVDSTRSESSWQGWKGGFGWNLSTLAMRSTLGTGRISLSVRQS